MSGHKKKSEKRTAVRSYPDGLRGKVFRTGGSLAIRLPKEVQPRESEVMISRVAEGLLITPAPVPASVTDWWESWEALPDFMGQGRAQPPMQKRKFG